MSGLGHKTGLMQCSKGILFDHFVGAAEQRRWYRQAERLGGFHIEDQLSPKSTRQHYTARMTQERQSWESGALLGESEFGGRN